MSEKSVGMLSTHVDSQMNACGDLIDLGDRATMGKGHAPNHAKKVSLVEAINSQLLTEISGRCAGKKFNHSIDLTGVTTTASSSDPIIETNNNSNEHQTAIREFKRLGTYCTLRPEQRRKHLLKVLPTLRNSMLLQTLLDAQCSSRESSGNLSQKASVDELLTTNKHSDIDSILIDLDDFIIDGAMQVSNRSNEALNGNENIAMHCKNYSQNKQNGSAVSILTPSGGSTLAISGNHSDSGGSCCLNIAPDKVEDCLLELDAYLEEIDRGYALISPVSFAPNSTKSSKCHTPNRTASEDAKNHNIDDNYRDCLLDIEQFCWPNDDDGANGVDDTATPPKRYHSQFNLNNEDCTTATTAQRQPHHTNLRKTISNSDIQMNRYRQLDGDDHRNGTRTDNERKSTNQMKRGHKLRNTIAGPMQKWRYSIGGDSRSSLCGVDHRKKRPKQSNAPALSWRRQSMRKTCPIVLPEQNIDHRLTTAIQPIASISPCETQPLFLNQKVNAIVKTSANDITNANIVAQSNDTDEDDENARYCFSRTMQPAATTTSDCFSANANMQMPSTSATIADHIDSIECCANDSTTTQLTDLNSFDNETFFLNSILQAQHFYPAPSSHSEIVAIEPNRVDLESDASDCVRATTESNRPRQMGRRSEMRSRIVSITAERNAEGNQRIIVNCDTGNVAPATTSAIQANCCAAAPPSTSSTTNQAQRTTATQRLANQCHQFTASEASSGASSRNPSPVSLASSSESSSTDGCQQMVAPTSANTETNIRSSPHRAMNSDTDTSSSNQANGNSSPRQIHSKTAIWPHGFSRILAATCCTLGLFNMSRFSIFSILFGANFIVQFFLLSFFLGIPMLWLQMCLGANIRGGPISMWRVSPICKGIGISLILVQALMAIYSAISLAWLLVYLRDSCISARYPWYRWQEIFEFFRGPSDNGIAIMSNTSEPTATSSKLGETVADYFNGVILQRFNLGPGGRISSGGSSIGAVRFQLAFNLAVVWLIVFIVLCKGLRLYGKIVIALTTLPLLAFTALTIKMLTLLNLTSFQNIFPATDWQDFFVNSQSWLSAASEVFLTWSLLGASVISIFSKSTKYPIDLNSTVLRRDALLVVAFTSIGLILAAIFGNACVQILNDRGFFYFPGSFETTTSSVFLLPSSKPLPPQLATSLSKWLPRYSTLLGESSKQINPNTMESGWQAIRLVTEIFPATLAAATLEHVSSFWSLLGFLLFASFGIGQLCAMWKPIANLLGTYSESISATSTTVLLTCLAGLLLGIPLTTESGINIIYFLDSVIGGAWFVLLLWTLLLFAIFLVRGRPYSGDILVNSLHLGQTLSAFVALSWNLLLPIGLLTLCVLQYKISYSYDFYHWSGIISQSYWPMWTRKVAAFIQIGIFQIIPITAIVQTYRYLSKGPPDILDRFQLLYRPTISSSSQRSHRYPLPRSEHQNARTNAARDNGAGGTTASSVPAIAVTLESNPISLTLDDAPPKYTPPPSYTTATGARIAKLLRNSIRRSVRRILGEPSGNNRRQRAPIQTHTIESSFNHNPYQNPPDYSTIADMATSSSAASNATYNPIDVNNLMHSPRVLINTEVIRSHHNNRRHTTTNFPTSKSLEKIDSFSSTMPRRSTVIANATDGTANPNESRYLHLTASDVAQLLRSTTNQQYEQINTDSLASNNHETMQFPANNDGMNNTCDTNEDYSLTRSVEELVLNEMPIGESNADAANAVAAAQQANNLCDK